MDFIVVLSGINLTGGRPFVASLFLRMCHMNVVLCFFVKEKYDTQ